MKREQKNNSGVLFRNDRKDGDRDRDYQGSALIDGNEYWISSWLNESKGGTKYMSLSFKPKLQSDSGSPPTGGKNDPRPKQPLVEDDFGDEVPF